MWPWLASFPEPPERTAVTLGLRSSASLRCSPGLTTPSRPVPAGTKRHSRVGTSFVRSHHDVATHIRFVPVENWTGGASRSTVARFSGHRSGQRCAPGSGRRGCHGVGQLAVEGKLRIAVELGDQSSGGGALTGVGFAPLGQ